MPRKNNNYLRLWINVFAFLKQAYIYETGIGGNYVLFKKNPGTGIPGSKKKSGCRDLLCCETETINTFGLGCFYDDLPGTHEVFVLFPD